MKHLFTVKFSLIIIAIVLASCTSPVDKPANLIPEDTFTALMADLAVNDQIATLNQNGNMETNTIFILKKYRVTPQQFTTSYKFYLAKPATMNRILDGAQDLIKNKDPEAAAYIKEKTKNNKAPQEQH